MKKEFRTTTGYVQWDDAAYHVTSVDDPMPPDGEGWALTGSCLSELRMSQQVILWFWSRGGAAGAL